MPIYTDHVQKGASPSGTKISVVAGGRGYRIWYGTKDLEGVVDDSVDKASEVNIELPL